MGEIEAVPMDPIWKGNEMTQVLLIEWNFQ